MFVGKLVGDSVICLGNIAITLSFAVGSNLKAENTLCDCWNVAVVDLMCWIDANKIIWGIYVCYRVKQ